LYLFISSKVLTQAEKICGLLKNQSKFLVIIPVSANWSEPLKLKIRVREFSRVLLACNKGKKDLAMINP